ncbi:Transmembrane amino acid transporter family protein [Prunus dulcis]|uniref:Transmembrane amino acid transporter family protein n=1 Tax=Prunus dulcis TaxID=3755 RepID=A0A4Y1S1G5_PRUDU|nr:Transmembrane amino acid transporter family protein [Prunus dulcis]
MVGALLGGLSNSQGLTLKMLGFQSLSLEMATLTMLPSILFVLVLEFKPLFFLLPSSHLGGWGIICMTLAFIWQLYTLYLLVQLHESAETGLRYCRYIQLCNASEKLAQFLALFPILYLSGGTCVALIVLGGSTAKMFFQIVCGPTCTVKSLTPAEWYLVFTVVASILSQLPNLNSIAGVSLVGAISAIGYSTLIWVVSLDKGKLPNVSYDPVKATNNTSIFLIGHNLILEIQATMPSSEKHPSRVPMWRGVQISYTLIALCIFPLAIVGIGHTIPAQGGMFAALFGFHARDTSQFILGLASLFVIINALSSFQIYGMPMFDEMESHYTRRFKKPAPWWLRAIVRCMFTYGCYFMAVAIPFLGSVAGLLGGISLPVTLAYPCFMWIKMKKPKKYGISWGVNWVLGVVGMILSVMLIAAGLYVVIDTGIKVSFFKPQ